MPYLESGQDVIWGFRLQAFKNPWRLLQVIHEGQSRSFWGWNLGRIKGCLLLACIPCITLIAKVCLFYPQVTVKFAPFPFMSIATVFAQTLSFPCLNLCQQPLNYSLHLRSHPSSLCSTLQLEWSFIVQIWSLSPFCWKCCSGAHYRQDENLACQ